ncbi:MAG: VCBS repeat-containing protein [Verrucomicrobiota bacterium]
MKISVALLFALCATAQALINPNFTPIHLMKQSDTVLDLQLNPAKDGVVTASVKSVIKGKFAAKTISLDLKDVTIPAQREVVEQIAGAPRAEPALFFIGKIGEEGDAAGGGGNAGNDVRGFLHAECQWISFDKDKDVWSMNDINNKMLGTWNGGTDMLRKLVDYILTDPDADVPCEEKVSWGKPVKFATLSGKVRAVAPVTLVNGGRQLLFVTADSGDKLFVYDDKSRGLNDVSSEHKLAAKSTVATWGDLNADGRMDLVSWNGTAVTVYLQDSNGVLQADAKLPASEVKGGCTSLAVIDSGVAGHPAVLIGTAAMPLLWTPALGAEAQAAKPVAAGEAPVKDLGAAGRCFVADFDGDGYADILQLFAKGSLVYKGKAVGQFESPKPCDVFLGPGNSDAFLGDIDGDGLLDLFTLGDNTRVWNNRGAMKFVNVMQESGEFTYKGATYSHCGAVGDINGDGRQDVICFYENGVPHINFNRGFRSFGHANSIDLQSTGVIPGAGDGQQTGCWTNLKGDGIQEIVIVLTNGEIWFMPVIPDGGSEKGGCVRVMLSSTGSYAGPLNVVGWRGKRCLGTWNVLPGTTEGFVAQNEAGPVTIKWRLPGGKLMEKKVTVENAPVKLMLP